MAELLKQLRSHRQATGLVMANFVDFDSLYGHRRNVAGYAQCIEDFDAMLGKFLPVLQNDELLIITADHGNDPTWSGTDHTREQVPLLMYSPGLQESVNVGTRHTYADLGATIMDNFGLTGLEFGTSFLAALK
jgi:phosphopentomutase